MGPTHGEIRACFIDKDEPARVLRFAEGWGIADPAVQRFLERSSELVYRPGEGMSGLAWQVGEPLWTKDVVNDPRSSKAGVKKVGSREIGIHGVFVFPIISAGDAIGVLNFASRRPREPEEQLLQAIGAIGVQIGQFLRRRQADEKRQILEEQLHQLVVRLGTQRARRENRALAPNEVTTACQDSCPTQAIIFGDMDDPKSAVAHLKNDSRDYSLLEELNVRPRTTYLARVRNPHPELG